MPVTGSLIVELYHNTTTCNIKISSVHKPEIAYRYVHAAMKNGVSDKGTIYE